MGAAWREALVQPLGIAGYALFLVFGIVTAVARRRDHKDHQWVIPVGFAMAVLCIAGGFALAYRHEVSASKPAVVSTPPPVPAMAIDKIEQHGDSSVAGVQGSVEINKNVSADPTQSAHKKKAEAPGKGHP